VETWYPAGLAGYERTVAPKLRACKEYFDGNGSGMLFELFCFHGAVKKMLDRVFFEIRL